MLNLPLNWRFVAAPVTLMLVVLMVYLSPLSQLLEFNRELIAAGEYWRVVTGHISHSNFYHLSLNGLGILLIWALHGEYYNTKQYALSISLLSLYCGASLYIFYPEISVYNGLSGVLHGLIVVGALIDCQKKMRTGYLLFVGIWLKIAWEQYTGPDESLGQLIDARVGIEAHLIGAISGIFVYAKLNMQELRAQIQS